MGILSHKMLEELQFRGSVHNGLNKSDINETNTLNCDSS